MTTLDAYTAVIEKVDEFARVIEKKLSVKEGPTPELVDRAATFLNELSEDDRLSMLVVVEIMLRVYRDAQQRQLAEAIVDAIMAVQPPATSPRVVH